MFALCSIDKPAQGKLYSKLASGPLLHFLYPSDLLKTGNRDGRRSISTSSRAHCSKSARNPSPVIENWFIDSLVKAGQCQLHAGTRSSKSSSTILNRTLPRNITNQARFFSRSRLHRSRAAIAAKNPVEPQQYHQDSRTNYIKSSTATRSPRRETESNVTSHQPRASGLETREDFLSLVDFYDEETPVETQDTSSDKHKRDGCGDQSSSSEGSSRFIQIQDEIGAKFQPWPLAQEDISVLDDLKAALSSKGADAEEVFELYRKLPSPRAPYIPRSCMNSVLRILGTARPDESSMLRYFSILDDMNAVRLPLRRDQWTSAIHLAGQYLAKVGGNEVAMCLNLWKKMENEGRVMGDHITFHVLFLVATRAKKHHLAEMIYTELIKRGLPFDRHNYVSLMDSRGRQRNGEGVRTAYRKLVELGEPVDMVVVNCLIASLLRAGEPEAGFNVYERLKRACNSSSKENEVRKKSKGGQEVPGPRSSLRPDLRTFRNLIRHAAVIDGDIHRVASLLADMRDYDIPTHGSIYLILFKAFKRHGGRGYTNWTLSRFENVWEPFLAALDKQGADKVVISRWTALWSLRALAAMSEPGLVMQAWLELRSKWKPTSDEARFVVQGVSALSRQSNV